MSAARKFDALARLLEYPGGRYSSTIDECRAALAGDEQSQALLDTFAAAVAPLSTEALQELFIQTFDLNPVCTLEVGWHLYGENYDRGAFMVRMRGELRRFGLKESEELPDHLAHVLAILERMEPNEGCQFAARFVLPALNKMLGGFKDKQNPFGNVMQAIWRTMHGLCPEVPLSVLPVTGSPFTVLNEP